MYIKVKMMYKVVAPFVERQAPGRRSSCCYEPQPATHCQCERERCRVRWRVTISIIVCVYAIILCFVLVSWQRRGWVISASSLVLISSWRNIEIPEVFIIWQLKWNLEWSTMEILIYRNFRRILLMMHIMWAAFDFCEVWRWRYRHN